MRLDNGRLTLHEALAQKFVVLAPCDAEIVHERYFAGLLEKLAAVLAGGGPGLLLPGSANRL